jgi:predicted DNA-binding transcriptional regulator AlpA
MKRPGAARARELRKELGYISEEDFRALLGMTHKSFQNRRYAGDFPPVSNLGREKLYRIVDVEAWIARRREQRGASRGVESAAA